MKNNRLILKIREVAGKNLGKAFFALFIMVVLEGLCSGLFAGPAVYLLSSENLFPGANAAAYGLLLAGIFIWFLFQSGFAVMLLRMVRNEFVTVGYLFAGFRKFKLLAPVAAINTFLTAGVCFILRGVIFALKQKFPEVFEAFSVWVFANESSVAGYADLILIAVFLGILLFIFLYGFLFFTQYRWDNPDLKLSRVVKLSFKTAWPNFFRIAGFAIRSCGRNLILAAFYFGMVMYFSGDQERFIVQVLSMIFDFLYFINIYKALVLFYMSLPVFYDDYLKPKIEIIISLDKDN